MRLENKDALSRYLEQGMAATLKDKACHKDRILINGRYKAHIEKVIKDPEYYHLVSFRKISGFQTVTEWLKATRALNKGRYPKYLIIINKGWT